MRTKEEIKSGLFKALDSVVKKTFYKRNFNDNFTEEELAKIKEIDAFIREVSLYKGEELLKQFMGRQYFFLSCKSVVKIKGKEICVFLDKAIPVEDFDYKKIEYFVAKCIYRLSQNRHIELYYGVNTFRALQMPSGIYMPERCGANASMASSVFMDIDLSDVAAALSNDELLGALKEDFEELFVNIPPSYILRSGFGVHLYYSLEQTIDIFGEEQKELWKETMRTLAQIFKSWGADFKIIDTARILRLPHSINRKPKYGKDGKIVEIMEYTGKRYDIYDLNAKLKFIEQGGMQELLREITDEEFMEEIYGPVFREVDFNEDIFGDDDVVYQNYTPKALIQTREEKTSKCKRMENPIAITVKEEKEAKEKKTSEKNILEKRKLIKKNDYEYKGIRMRYGKTETYWQNIDLFQWIADRDNHEGCRTSLLFIMGYNWYHFGKAWKYERLWEKYQYLNNILKPSLPLDELEKYCKYNFEYYREKTAVKCVRNETIQKFFPFTEEERDSGILIGIYCETREEYEKKRKEKQRKFHREAYDKKLQQKGKLRRSEQKALIKTVFEEDIHMSYKEFEEKTGLSRASYTLYKKELGIAETQKKRAERIANEYLQPFIDNPKITLQEYMELMNCKRSTYFKYKKIYLDSKK